YKYDHGHILPNMQAYHGEVKVTQGQPKHAEPAGQAGASNPVAWINADTGAKLADLGDQAFESKLTRRQQAICNLPAILVSLVVTAFLVKGISESAGFNALMVAIKVLAVLFVIFVGLAYIKPENWEPFAPYGWTGLSFFGKHLHGNVNDAGQPVGMLAGAAIIFFAYIG
ncbi:MAG: amino acid permease, partial [Planctomycetaceae bacterium]